MLYLPEAHLQKTTS